MKPDDPNLAKVEIVAAALGSLCDELVFVGGCAAGLLLSDPAATQARLTNDVDLVAEVTALRGYHVMEGEFARRGFVRDMSPAAPICRWRCRDIEVDLMPTDARILGFANRWYLGQRCTALLATPNFDNYLPGLLAQDETLAQRVTVANSRLQSIAAFAHP